MQQSLASDEQGARRKASALFAMLIAIAAAIAMMTGPVSSASANPSKEFCNHAQLQPYGHANSECDQYIGEAAPYFLIGVQTFARAGCERVTGYNGEPITEWACTGANSLKATYTSNNPSAQYRGAIRNNNMSFTAEFSGFTGCCWE